MTTESWFRSRRDGWDEVPGRGDQGPEDDGTASVICCLGTRSVMTETRSGKLEVLHEVTPN